MRPQPVITRVKNNGVVSSPGGPVSGEFSSTWVPFIPELHNYADFNGNPGGVDPIIAGKWGSYIYLGDLIIIRYIIFFAPGIDDPGSGNVASIEIPGGVRLGTIIAEGGVTQVPSFISGYGTIEQYFPESVSPGPFTHYLRPFGLARDVDEVYGVTPVMYAGDDTYFGPGIWGDAGTQTKIDLTVFLDNRGDSLPNEDPDPDPDPGIAQDCMLIYPTDFTLFGGATLVTDVTSFGSCAGSYVVCNGIGQGFTVTFTLNQATADAWNDSTDYPYGTTVPATGPWGVPWMRWKRTSFDIFNIDQPRGDSSWENDTGGDGTTSSYFPPQAGTSAWQVRNIATSGPNSFLWGEGDNILTFTMTSRGSTGAGVVNFDWAGMPPPDGIADQCAECLGS